MRWASGRDPAKKLAPPAATRAGKAWPILCLLLLAAGASPKKIDITPSTHPALGIAGDDVARYANGQLAAFRGFADPCVRKAPNSQTLHMLYSRPHMQHLGGGPRNYAIGVETNLAASTDAGKTWRKLRTLWPRTPATYAGKSGFISHEVPNFVHLTIDRKPAVVAARLDYFLGHPGGYKARDNQSFVIQLLTAPTVEQLATAPAFTVGHSRSSKDAGVDLDLTALHRDFPAIFIPNEPALYFHEGKLFLAFVVMTFKATKEPDFPASFIAVLSTTPTGDPSTWKWTYEGKLATHADAQEFGAESLTQIELAESKGGKLLALCSPESWNPKAGGADAFAGIVHHGCVVLEVDALAPPRLARTNGKLNSRASLHSTFHPDHGPGAAGYDPASVTGVLYTLRDIANGSFMAWSIHPTRVHP
jgi:hypothetical protein